jgi:hypothetical protein
MRQVGIYLKQTGSELVHQTSFTMENTHHEFEVVRLWEQPASLFLEYPGLISFAVLGQSADAEETLRQAAQRVDLDRRSSIASYGGTLCKSLLFIDQFGEMHKRKISGRLHSIFFEKACRLTSLLVGRDYRSKKFNNFSNNSIAPHKAEVDFS